MINLQEYAVRREAGLPPCVLDCTGMSGKSRLMFLTESVPETEPFEDKIKATAAEYLDENGDEMTDESFRLIARLPIVFEELARESGVSTAEMIGLLLDPEPEYAEEASSVLDEIVADLREMIAAEIAEENEELTAEDWKEIVRSIESDQIRRVAEAMVPRGQALHEHKMALPFQSEKPKREVRNVLRSGFMPGSEGDSAFAAIHKVEVHGDLAGNGDDVFRTSNIRKAMPLVDSAITRSVPLGESPSPWAVQVLPGLRRR